MALRDWSWKRWFALFVVLAGWAARPDLDMPAAFWQGTGYSPAVGPCR